MSFRFDGRVAIVTDAGGGLSREYGLELARRSARVAFNDLGAARDGTGRSDAALRVVAEIEATGGETTWRQSYGRVLMTASSSGLFGNLGHRKRWRGQARSRRAAETLSLEGAKNGIRVNTLAPVAGTRMTADLFPEQAFDAFSPDKVNAAALFLVSDEAPSNAVVGAGAGVLQSSVVTLTQGKLLAGGDLSPEGVAAHWAEIVDRAEEIVPQSGAEQAMLIGRKLRDG